MIGIRCWCTWEFALVYTLTWKTGWLSRPRTILQMNLQWKSCWINMRLPTDLLQKYKNVFNLLFFAYFDVSKLPDLNSCMRRGLYSCTLKFIMYLNPADAIWADINCLHPKAGLMDAYYMSVQTFVALMLLTCKPVWSKTHVVLLSPFAYNFSNIYSNSKQTKLKINIQKDPLLTW